MNVNVKTRHQPKVYRSYRVTMTSGIQFTVQATGFGGAAALADMQFQYQEIVGIVRLAVTK